MPKVPQYQESQRFGNAPDARFSVDGRALSSALGGETWGAVAHAGRQMRAAGGQLGGIALDMMRQHNETVAMDRLNKAEAAILDMQTEQSKRLGGNALDSEDGKRVGVSGTLRAGLDKLRGELTQGMNPAQKKLFDSAFTPRGRSVLRWGASFEAQQREVFTTSTEDGKLAVDAQRALANYGDREQVDAALGNTLFVLERRGKRLGLAPEAVQAQRTEAAHKLLLPVFDAMLDKGELAQARQYVQAYGGLLGAGTAAAVQAKIRARGEALAAQAEAARRKAEDQAEKRREDEAFAQLDAAVKAYPLEQQESALVRLTADIDDPKLRRAVYSRAKEEQVWRADVHKADIQEQVLLVGRMQKQNGWNHNQTLAYIMDTAAAPELKAQVREKWTKARDADKEASAAHLDAIRAWIDENRGQVSETRLRAHIFQADLSPDDAQKAVDYATSEGKYGMLPVSDFARMYKDASGQKKVPAGLYDYFLEQWPNGEKYDPKLAEMRLARMIMKGESEGRGRVWGDRNESLWEAEAAGRGPDWLPGSKAISDVRRQRAEEFLLAKGYTPTDELIRMYAKVEMGLPHDGVESLDQWPTAADLRAASRENAPGSAAGVASVTSAASSARAGVPATEARRTAADATRQKAMREDSATGGASYRQVAEERRTRAGATLTPLPLPEALQDLPENADALHHDYVVVFGELPPAGMSESDMKTAIQDRIEEDLDTSIFSGAYARQVRALRVAYLKEHLRGDVRHPGTGKRPKDWK